MEVPCRDGVSYSRSTWALRLGDSGEEGHEADAAEELGDEDGGVDPRLGAVGRL